MCNYFVTNLGKVIPQSRMAVPVMGTLAPANVVMAEPRKLCFSDLYILGHMWKLPSGNLT